MLNKKQKKVAEELLAINNEIIHLLEEPMTLERKASIKKKARKLDKGMRYLKNNHDVGLIL